MNTPEFKPRKGDQIQISYVLEGQAFYDEINFKGAEEHFHEKAMRELGTAYAKANAKQEVTFWVPYQDEAVSFWTRDQAEFFCMKAKPPIDFALIEKRVELTLG